MPKAAKAASSVTRGGYGDRRTDGDTTPTGRGRSAPQWTAAAALQAAAQLQHSAAANGSSLLAAMRDAISGEAAAVAFTSGAVFAAGSKPAAALARDIMVHHAQVVQQQPHRLAELAKHVLGRLRKHAGPADSVEPKDARRPVAPLGIKLAAGAWLDDKDEPSAQCRPPPPADARIVRGLRKWGLERLGPLPAHAVVCFERAESRVNYWRTKTRAGPGDPPPLKLLQALVHTQDVPTLTANESDHFYLPALARWASVPEMLRLFQIPLGSAVAQALCDPTVVTARQAGIALGKAVHYPSARHALKLALRHPEMPTTVRYASACSGIDVFAAVMQSLRPDAWTYVLASEPDPVARGALLAAHAHAGLDEARVPMDATQSAACELAPAADVWVVTPPCEKYSRRNHNPSEEDLREAAEALDAMMQYPRTHRPLAVVVENVDEPEARTAITATLLTVPAYDWYTFAALARETGVMLRERRFWVGLRRPGAV